MTDEERKQKAWDRYTKAAHGIQTAIKHSMDIASTANQRHPSTEPKHLRVGIDLSKAEQGGLARLLIAKGVFTETEYFEAMADAVELELRIREGQHPGVKFR